MGPSAATLVMDISLGQILRRARETLKRAGIAEPANEAYALLGALTGKDIGWLAAHADDTRAEGVLDVTCFETWLSRRAQREPLAYIRGEKEFWGRSFRVGPGVLVPRPETEILIEWVLSECREKRVSAGLDLCTGSGIIAITLGLELGIPFDAVDHSTLALDYARFNIARHQCSSRCHLTDVLQPLPFAGKVDLMTINPPYVASSDMRDLEPEVRDHEPSAALDGGRDEGTAFLLRGLPLWREALMPEGRLFVEIGAGQADRLRRELPRTGFSLKDVRRDLAGIERILCLVPTL